VAGRRSGSAGDAAARTARLRHITTIAMRLPASITTGASVVSTRTEAPPKSSGDGATTYAATTTAIEHAIATAVPRYASGRRRTTICVATSTIRVAPVQNANTAASGNPPCSSDSGIAWHAPSGLHTDIARR